MSLMEDADEIKYNAKTYNGPLPPPTSALLVKQRPTGPSLLYNDEGEAYCLPIARLDVFVEFHVSTAFGRLTGVWVNTSEKKISALLAIPLKGTVTEAHIKVGKNRILETAVIPASDANDLVGDQQVAQDNPLDQYIPDLFRLPVSNIEPGEHIQIEVTFLQPLEIFNGAYHFSLGLQFPVGLFPQGMDINQLVRVHASINSVIPGIMYDSQTHHLVIRNQSNLRVELDGHSKTGQSSDFHISYYVPSKAILGSLLHSPQNPSSWDPRGTFCLFLTPPTDPPGMFGRDIIFLIDRSGSMYGGPFEEASKGIEHALSTLHHGDRFNIVMFDDQQVSLSGELVHWSEQALEQALEFVDSNPPRGLTDISTPLFWAIDCLKHTIQQEPGRLPFVVLLTDGAVDNEREICHQARDECGPVRILTFGIGTYCNWYFLKMLALVSRGYNSGAVYKEELYQKMVGLMDMASVPALTDITVNISNLDSCEIYPYPIPDLFVGAPLTISGKFTGMFPLSVILRGRMWDGQPFEQEIPTNFSETIPLTKVFLKQRIDLLTAQQWLEDSKEIEKEIIDTSTQESFPSKFTTMVAYETTQKKRDEQDEELKEEIEKKGSKKMSKGTVAALAIGGVAVIGVAAFMFGDLAATGANTGAFTDIFDGIGDLDGFGDFFGDVGCCCDGCLDAVTCGLCESCDGIAEGLTCGQCGDCGECGDILSCGVCGDCNMDLSCDGCTDALPSCDCGGCGDTIAGGCGDAAAGCEGCFEECSTTLVEICRELCDGMSAMCECLNELTGE